MKHDSDILKRIKSYFMRRRSAEEAHAFEREIERDNFLYEAIEGYEDMLTSDIQQSLDELDDRLDDKTKRSAFVLTWQAAAIAIIIAGGITMFAIIGGNGESSSESGPVATEEKENSYNPRKRVSSFESLDSIEDVVAKADTNTTEIQDEKSEDMPVAMQDVNEPVAQKDMQAESEKLKREKTEQSETEPATASDQDEVMATAPAETTKTEDVALNDAMEMDLAEESVQVATGSKTRVISSKSKSSAESTPKSSVASPEGGMAAYQGYLKKNLQRSPGMPSGKVVLTFEFDRDGVPKKIEVKNSLCTACDAEAIRLIEEGPKWNTEDRKKRTQVSVEF